MARDQGVKTPAKGSAAKPVRAPAAKPAALAVAPVAKSAVAVPKRRVSISQFAREVRAEGRKVTWTSWRETWITSVMVLIMVVLTAAFFSIIDGVLSFLMHQFLRLAA